MQNKITRRQAIKAGVLATGVWLGSSRQPRAAGPNERLNIACIGIGGRGGANLNAVSRENIVALCDVDEERAGRNFERFRNAQRFEDFRRMYDRMERQIDAVVISTPDHTHFHPAYMAIQRGKHVYLEKPMAHNVWQVRQLTDLARQRRVATQLGVQRHTIPNMARVVELIRAGTIGDVTEVHSWISSRRGMRPDPEYPPVPNTLNWDLWLGPAPQTRYSPSYAPYSWRYWWNYGTGETGNWGCHILDIPFWALDLRYPTRVSASDANPHPRKTPTSLTTQFEFPATKDRRAVTLHWYQIGSPPILRQRGLSGRGANTVFVGTRGILVCGFNSRRLYPEEQFRDHEPPRQTIERSPGFHREWLNACRGGPAPTCNFDYSGPLTETVLLANAAFRAGGSPFNWNGERMAASGNNNVNQFLREPFRRGWELDT